ncbi:hypothetical protein [Bradyrhizobium sp. Ai1a-2]|uniref:hypothetical protein n=1 Tax=Bradyrhizobium sp. Ai1a-2 TaxID=196490 RepID=UPI000400556E|nr:hypothetical protein [Bradyrhizobium sp. Ai1a-2]
MARLRDVAVSPTRAGAPDRLMAGRSLDGRGDLLSRFGEAAIATSMSAGCAVGTSFNAALIRGNRANLIVNSWGTGARAALGCGGFCFSNLRAAPKML